MPLNAMPATTGTEAALQHDIEALRARFSRTQELYREVCALLFFRYGITPTANKLYQLVRKGSMSAPAEALAQFWAELREKSRTRIEHPDLPEPLGEAAGQLVAQLWQAAQQAAHEALAAYRREAEQGIATAQQVALAAEQDRDLQLAKQSTRVNTLEDALHATQAQNTLLREHLTTVEAARDAAIRSLADEKAEKLGLHHNLEAQRKAFTEELDALRSTMQLAEERARSNERRWLLDIDRERTQLSKLQKQLEQQIARQQADNQRHQTALQEAQDKTTAAQQQCQTLDQALQQSRTQINQLTAEQHALQARLVSAEQRAQVLQAQQASTSRSTEQQVKRKRKAVRRPVRETFPRA